MAGGIGDIFGGVGSIVGSIINSRNQARANDIAESNVLLQAMLGQENLDEQRRIGDRNFDLQRKTADKNYKLADTEGTRVYDTARKFLGQNLDLQRESGKQLIGFGKSSKFDASGDEVYYDPATNAFKVRLTPANQRLKAANDRENYLRSTEDQVRARQGNVDNENQRHAASRLLDEARADMYSSPPVNEGQLANELIVADRGAREDHLKALRNGLVSNAMRTNNSGTIKDIGDQVRASPNSITADAGSAILNAQKQAATINNSDKIAKLRTMLGLTQAAHFNGDRFNPMGESPDFDTTTRQADAGINSLAKAVQGNAGMVGGAITAENAGLTGAINSRANAMMGALTGGAQAQGNALNNLASALAAGYGAQASGIGSALTNEAKLVASNKLDLSGFGQIGKGLGGLFAALGNNNRGEDDYGGVSTIAKSDYRAF